MKKRGKFWLILSLLGSLTFSLSDALALDCSKEKIEQSLERFILVSDEIKARTKVHLFETRKVKLGNLDFCEVVYSVDDPQVEPAFKKIKFVAFLHDDLFISGDVRIIENNKVKHVVQEKFLEINKSVFEELRGQDIQSKEKLSDSKIFEDKVDIILGALASEAMYDIYVLVDPRCPYSARVIDYFNKLLSERKDVKVNYIITPILGEASKNIAVSVLCDIKDAKERLAKLKKGYTSKNLCNKGREKVEANITLFTDLGFRGVPVEIIFKKDEKGNFAFLDVVSGANIPLLEKLIK